MAKATTKTANSSVKLKVNNDRFVLVIDGREIARASTFAKAKDAFVKHRGKMRDHDFRRPTIQDTAPAGKAGEAVPIIWEYRGCGVWHVAREHTITNN